LVTYEQRDASTMPLQLMREGQWSISVPMDDRSEEALSVLRQCTCPDEVELALVDALRTPSQHALALTAVR
jgi:hypothetical protein